jgi:hypothetical protein
VDADASVIPGLATFAVSLQAPKLKAHANITNFFTITPLDPAPHRYTPHNCAIFFLDRKKKMMPRRGSRRGQFDDWNGFRYLRI